MTSAIARPTMQHFEHLGYEFRVESGGLDEHTVGKGAATGLLRQVRRFAIEGLEQAAAPHHITTVAAGDGLGQMIQTGANQPPALSTPAQSIAGGQVAESTMDLAGQGDYARVSSGNGAAERAPAMRVAAASNWCLSWS